MSDEYSSEESIDFGSNAGPRYQFVKIPARGSIVLAFLSGKPVDTYYQDGMDGPRLRGTGHTAQKHDVFLVYVPSSTNGDGSPIACPENGIPSVARLDVKGYLRGALADARVKPGQFLRISRTGAGKATRFRAEAIAGEAEWSEELDDIRAKLAGY